MKYFNKLNINLDRYLLDTESKIIIKKNYLNIINYKEIKNFTPNVIIIKTNKTITIKGDKLVINKMQDNEVLITGTIKTIEL